MPPIIKSIKRHRKKVRHDLMLSEIKDWLKTKKKFTTHELFAREKVRYLNHKLYANKTLPLPSLEKEKEELWDGDPNCKHNIISLWNGVKCTKCGGWYCL